MGKGNSQNTRWPVGDGIDIEKKYTKESIAMSCENILSV